jgi:hypothetical protein
MNRADFLKLITETYFNTFDECIEDVDFLDFSFEYRKNQFLKQIERRQKAVEKDFGISLKDFIEESNFAITFLDGQIAINIREEIKNKSESELNDIINNDVVIYVPLQKVNTKLTGIVCQKDVDYIKICFKSFVSQPQEPKAEKPNETYKTQNLFKVGLLFATGEMNKYYTINNLNEIVLNDGLSPLKIATELDNTSFEKYILASKNNYKTGENKSKNIFNNLAMMNNIINHCKTKKLDIDPYFESRLPTEKI